MIDKYYGKVFTKTELQWIHLFLLTFYLLMTCMLLDFASFGTGDTTLTDRWYGYMQILSTIGFGDVIIESDIFFLYIIDDVFYFFCCAPCKSSKLTKGITEKIDDMAAI